MPPAEFESLDRAATETSCSSNYTSNYRGTDKSLARPGSKQATVTILILIYPIYNHS